LSWTAWLDFLVESEVEIGIEIENNHRRVMFDPDVDSDFDFVKTFAKYQRRK
jgi:hypothetical protein